MTIDPTEEHKLTTQQQLDVEIFFFWYYYRNGQLNHPVDLARKLERLADLAWNEVDQLYPPSIKIEP